MRTIVCRCERSFEADIPEEIDLDREEGRLEEILSGNFFAFSCPNCGEKIKPELSVRLRSRKRALDVFVIPEIERLSFYLGKVEPPKGAEILIGYEELYERSRILVDGLDAEAVEVVKYWLAAKASEMAAEGSELSILYAGKLPDGRLRFHIQGIKEGEVAVLPVGVDYYDKIRSELPRTRRNEPFDRLLAGPYKSIRSLEMED